MKISLTRFSALAFAASLLAATTLASGASAQDAEGIVVYNAQHESLGRRMGRRLHQGDRHQGDPAPGQRHGVRQPDRPGRRGFAGRRVPDREFAGDGAGRQGGPVRAGGQADTLEQVPAKYRPPNGHWTAIAARSTVFAYDKTQARPKTSCRSRCSTSPIRAGRAAGPRRPSGADFQAIVGALLQLKGEDATAAWLKAMKENCNALQGQQRRR